MINKEQIKRIYALGAGLGMVDSNDINDMLHQLVYNITQKVSVKSLSDADYKAVERELLNRYKLGHLNHPPIKNTINANISPSPGKATPEQIKLCWRFCYRLKELDPNPQSAIPADRLIGAINKVLGVTASKKDPFRWVTQEQAALLIEQLKRFVRSAERKQKRLGDVNAN